MTSEKRSFDSKGVMTQRLKTDDLKRLCRDDSQARAAENCQALDSGFTASLSDAKELRGQKSLGWHLIVGPGLDSLIPKM